MFFRKDSSINKLFSFALAAFLALGPAGCGGVTGPGLTLGSADITDSFSGGNSDGATSGGGFSGRWAAKFYGNGASATDQPCSIAGTFGAKTDDELRTILGVFIT